MLHELDRAASLGGSRTLYDASREVYGLLRYGARVRWRAGGIPWHTQGSGKSLTMVWLAKWIREHVPHGRVFIVTDRTELDEQIEQVFRGAARPSAAPEAAPISCERSTPVATG